MTRSESNSVVCNASREAVYAVIGDSARWPELLEPCLAVRHLAREHRSETIEVTALVNGQKMTWQSRRAFLPEVFGIDSQVLQPMPLVKTMAATWRVMRVSSEESLLVLEHTFDVLDDPSGLVEGVQTREQAIAFISKAIRANSATELGNIKAAAELGRSPSLSSTLQTTCHSVVCEASAEAVYAAISNVDNWPKMFDACLSTTRLEQEPASELVRIEALQKGKVVSWVTRRQYFPEIFRVDFVLPVPMPFLKSMAGQWRVVPLTDSRAALCVTREFEFVSDVTGIREGIETLEQAQRFVNEFIEQNADAEMLAVKAFTENRGDTFAAFSEKFLLPYSPRDVFASLANVKDWPKMLPHCRDIDVIYDDSINQEFVLRVKTAEGEEFFRSVRTCDPETLSISYFQPVPPRVLRTHSGSWRVRSVAGGAEVTSKHEIHIALEQCAEAFGDQSAHRNKDRVRELISKNSRATVEACGLALKQRLESAGG